MLGMTPKPNVKVSISQSYEVWQGLASVARVRELRGIGMTLTAVAERFQVSRQTIYEALKATKSPDAPKSTPGGAESQTTKQAKGRLPQAATPSASAHGGN